MSVRKLTTRQIFQRNQQRHLPSGFERTIIWLHDIRSLHNVGSAFRTADAFGISQVLLSGFTPTPPRTEITKTAIGAEAFVKWQYFADVLAVKEYLNSMGCRVVVLEQTESSVPIFALPVDTPAPFCLVFGNEVDGVNLEILAMADTIAEIPQYGQKHSFNVSVCVGISLFALHECYRNASV